MTRTRRRSDAAGSSRQLEREDPGASRPQAVTSNSYVDKGLSLSAPTPGYERGSRTRVSPPMTDVGVEHIFAVNRPCCPVNG